MVWNKGKNLSDNHKENIRKKLKGRIPWNKGLKGFRAGIRRTPVGFIPWNKGKTYDECFGIEKSNKLKKDIGDRFRLYIRNKHHNWKGGLFNRNGYIYIIDKENKIADSDGYVMLHRKVIDEKIGGLPKTYVVHHIDRNKLNNQINNLIYLPNQSMHLKLEKYPQEIQKIINYLFIL